MLVVPKCIPLFQNESTVMIFQSETGMRDLSEIVGKVVACLAAESTLSCSGKSMWLGTHINVILLLIEYKLERVRRIFWMRGLEL